MKSSSSSYKVARITSWIIAAILVLLPFHALFTTFLASNVGHFDLIRIWKEIILVLILPPVFWLAWRTPKLKKWLLDSWIVRLFAIYAALHIILGVWAIAHHQVNKTALIYALIINLRFIGFFIICFIVASCHDLLKRYWQVILLAPGLVVIAFGLLQKFILPYDFLRHLGYGPKTIPAYQTVDSNIDYRRIQSTLRGANPLGAYLVLIITALSVAWKKISLNKAIILSAAFVVLFFSYSRSALVGVILALVFLAWRSYRLKINWTLLFLASIIVIVCSLFLLKSNRTAEDTLLHTSSSSTSSQSSNSVRTSAIKSGLHDVYYQPLGRGPGTAGPASVRNNHPPRIAEDYYLQIGQEVGILGMLLFIAINVIVAMQLWQKKHSLLAQLLLASLLGLTFVNLVSHAWTDDTLSYIWWGMAGIALAPDILEKRLKANVKTHKT